MWALILLSLAVFAWAKWIHQEIELYGEANLGLEAKSMAHSGMAVALNPAVSKVTPLLEQQLGTQRGYKVRMVSEGGKLNLRFILEGEDPRRIDMFKRWLEIRGMDFQQREAFVDCLLDYIDPDENHRLNGVEETSTYKAANRMIKSLEEIEAIPGAEALLRSPGWKDQLTLYSQGPIDLLAAPADILRLLPAFGDSRIQLLLSVRGGKDGIDGTQDDMVFQNVAQVLTYLGFSKAESQAVSGLVGINDRTMHITSVGQVGKVVRQVEVVARKNAGTKAQIVSWKE
jgi:type II secretory pathway component PulK